MELPPTTNWWADCGRNGEERGVLCLDDENRTRPKIKKGHEKTRKAYIAKKRRGRRRRRAEVHVWCCIYSFARSPTTKPRVRPGMQHPARPKTPADGLGR